jgi:phenylacetate-CoA ligase
MNLLLWAKHNLRNIPPGIGKYLSLLPYGYRPGIGPTYRKRHEEIAIYDNLDENTRRNFIFQRVKNVVNYANNNIPFYQKFYYERGFNPDSLRDYEYIQDIPVIGKSDLNQIELEFRSSIQKDRYKTNTGGSSGLPLSFYIQSSFMGTEWAHMHTIWGQFGYKVSDIKLVFIGVGAKNENPVQYDFVRNSFMINIYANPIHVINEIKKILSVHTIRFLHGYPSAIYSFALSCSQISPDLTKMLRKNLKAVFLNSEFPQPHFRNTIEEAFGVPTLSWYGHTERCVLAYEKGEKFHYTPMQTYGYVEALKIDKEKSNLIGTSYYNFSSPFIRYNTGDLIENCQYDKVGILNKFSINDGRSGEFIMDANNNRIPLTGLIFGRHHKLFDLTSFIQVKQDSIGFATIYFVWNDAQSFPSNLNFSLLFDSSEVDIRFNFEEIKNPILTSAGKLNLLIK